MKKKNKIKAGYQKKPSKQKARKRESSWLSKLIIAPYKKVSIGERVVKILIYFALRIVTKPSKWKQPKKNYEIIDRTYKRIMSSDFIFIPSSIAFYVIMAFIPIFFIISLLYYIDPFVDFLNNNLINGYDPIEYIIGNFIPGSRSVLEEIKAFATTGSSASIGAFVSIILSLLLSVWIASAGFAKLVYTQSYIFKHKFLGGYWMNRIKGLFMVFSFVCFLLAMLLVNIIVINGLNNLVSSSFWARVVDYVWLSLSLFLGIFLGLIILFKLSPRYHIRLRHTVPGAMVATIPTTGFLVLFGGITSLWSYDVYGVFGSIMYIGMTSLIIMYFVFVGIITNAAYYKTFVSDSVQNKWTISKK